MGYTSCNLFGNLLLSMYAYSCLRSIEPALIWKRLCFFSLHLCNSDMFLRYSNWPPEGLVCSSCLEIYLFYHLLMLLVGSICPLPLSFAFFLWRKTYSCIYLKIWSFLQNVYHVFSNGWTLFYSFSVHLLYPDQPLIKAKQLFCLENLLRKKGYSGNCLLFKLHNWAVSIAKLNSLVLQ